VTVGRLDQIFHRVNIEEEYDEKKLAENPLEYRNAMILKEDPFNPNNQFIRGEFYEVLHIALVLATIITHTCSLIFVYVN
jgi:hypothetical protein